MKIALVRSLRWTAVAAAIVLGTPLMTQWRGGQPKVVWPFDLASTEVLYPLPKWLERK